ncbi:MAG: response regulator [Blastocatellia bacterium]|nr:response regulator [Blastocatellia bacterium]
MTIRTLIVDDHAFFRKTLREYLNDLDSVEVVGEAGNGQEAIEAAGRLHPSLVIMDINMPLLDGLEASAIIRQNEPDSMMVLYTLRSTNLPPANPGLRADMCLAKENLFDELPGLIKRLMGGS